MTIKDKLEVIEADSFSNSTVYRMTLKYEGETFYFRGEQHEYGGDYYWYNSEGNKIAQPDWVDELEESLEKENKSIFDLCEEKEKENEKSFDWLCTKVLEICPTATFERDNEGQVIIYTDLTEDETGTLKKLEEEELPRDLVADHEQTRSADAEMGDL